jgi:hypothetical protein
MGAWWPDEEVAWRDATPLGDVGIDDEVDLLSSWRGRGESEHEYNERYL